jgi:hypothetical protein
LRWTTGLSSTANRPNENGELAADAGSARWGLLLDENYLIAIADQLRCGGHDLEAVTARPALRSLSDVAILATTQIERQS